ncbi:MAG: 5-formyltetrahydrofolate cyclo-ligase, partial [Actinomycetota bacterium]|nr:5-formyltetrahydrofolate cyclo-ligase [Actinomycetota bacterium]
AVRAGLPPAAREAAATRIRRRLSALPELTAARAVLGYAAFGSEVDLDPFLRDCIAREVDVFLPRVEHGRLSIARVHDLDADLVPGWRGVREVPVRARPGARVEQLDAVVMPGVAFDRRAQRLGYGGGYFDRLLALLPAGIPTIGAAFDVQVVEAVPVEAHDRRVHVVVTESREIRPGGHPPASPPGRSARSPRAAGPGAPGRAGRP